LRRQILCNSAWLSQTFPAKHPRLMVIGWLPASCQHGKVFAKAFALQKSVVALHKLRLESALFARIIVTIQSKT
jgi:hypothetical protein